MRTCTCRGNRSARARGRTIYDGMEMADASPTPANKKTEKLGMIITPRKCEFRRL